VQPSTTEVHLRPVAFLPRNTTISPTVRVEWFAAEITLALWAILFIVVILKVINMRMAKFWKRSSFSAKKVKLFSVGEYSPTRGPLGNIPQLG